MTIWLTFIEFTSVQVNTKFRKFEVLHKNEQRQDWDTDMLYTSTYSGKKTPLYLQPQ